MRNHKVLTSVLEDLIGKLPYLTLYVMILFPYEPFRNISPASSVSSLKNVRNKTHRNFEVVEGSLLHATALLVDSHVHIYDCYEIIQFLNSAEANIRHAASSLGLPPSTPGCLMLAESARYDRFRELYQLAEEGVGPWRFSRTDEDCSLIVNRDGQTRLILVAGRQIVTAEKLEVLALGCTRCFDDGQPIESVIRSAMEQEALIVLPWGVGKWWFARGAVIRRIIESIQPGCIYLGDNGGRLRLGLRPSLFKAAQAKDIRILPGSDPLPFPRQGNRAGKYGFVLEGNLNLDQPAASIKSCLTQSPLQLTVFGRLAGPWEFLHDQIAMQLRKRKP